jgi:predicted nuclease of predicted toxin-antitoxin system
VLYVAELSPSVGDDVVLQQARSGNSLLLTADKDFGELVFRQRLLHSGVILLRLAGLASEKKAEIVSITLKERTDELTGAFSVISPGAVRIRR